MSPESVQIVRSAWEAMREHVCQAAPLEACGLLAGRSGLGREVFLVPNAAASRTRFRMEPRAQLEALLGMERQGLDLVAIFHSHPAGPDGPSATDLAEAAYPEAAYLIWTPGDGGWSCRAFRLRPGGFEPIPSQVVD